MSILGQATNTNTNAVVYTVPTGKTALITKVWIFDDEATDRSYQIRVLPAAVTAPGTARYNVLNTKLLYEPSSNGFIEFQHPLTLNAADQLVVVPGVAGALPDSVTVFGEEANDTTTYATPLPATLVGTTLTDMYTVPAGKKLAIATMVLAVEISAARRVWLSMAKAGAADTAAQYVLVNYRLEASDVYCFAGGMTLDAGDVIRCRTDAANAVALSIYGVLQ